MAANIVQHYDKSGNKEYPVTSSAAVGMSDGSGDLDSKLTELSSSISKLKSDYEATCGYYINSRNKIIAYSASRITNFLVIPDGIDIEFHNLWTADHNPIIFFDENFAIISSLDCASNYTLKSSDKPENAKYICAQYQVTTNDKHVFYYNCKYNIDTGISFYEKCINTNISSIKEEISSINGNISELKNNANSDKNDFLSFKSTMQSDINLMLERGKNLFNGNITRGKYITYSGNVVSGIGSFSDIQFGGISDYIKVKPNTQYTVGFKTWKYSRCILFADSLKNKSGNGVVISYGTYNTTFTTGDDTEYIAFDYGAEKKVVNDSDIKATVLMEGNTIDYQAFYGKPKQSFYESMVKAIIEGQSINIENPLYGKKIGVDGDSICYGVGYLGGYAKIISDKNSMELINLAVGGATISAETYGSDQITQRHWISRSIKELPDDCDYVIAEGGVNDPLDNLGTMTQYYDYVPDDTTFIGGLESICKTMYEKFPGKKVGFIIVHAVSNFSAYRKSEKYLAIIDVLKKWGIPYLDLNILAPPFGLFPTDNPLRLTYTKDGDGWHPNEDGYKKYYCDKIEQWLKSL